MGVKTATMAARYRPSRSIKVDPMPHTDDFQRIYELAEDCVSVGRYTEAAKVLAALMARDPDPDHPRIAAVLDAVIDIADDPVALVNRALMLLDPQIGPYDPERAFGFLRDAADQTEDPDHPEHALAAVAHALLGDCYIRGHGVAADAEAGVGHYRIAADLGSGKAALSMALALDNGLLDQAVDQDEAVRFYRMAADRGEAAAMTRLAVLYLTERSPPDDLEPIDLLERASALGDDEAASLLDRLSEDDRTMD